MGYRRQERVAGVGGVGELSGGHQTVDADSGVVGEVVKHEEPSTQPGGAHLEARRIGRKRVAALEPDLVVSRSGGVGVVVAVVDDEFKHPVRVLDGFRGEEKWSLAVAPEQRNTVA